MQITFQTFCRSQPLNNASLSFNGVIKFTTGSLETSLYPAFLRDVADVHVFRADAAAIDATQSLHYLAQRHARATHQRTGAESGFHVRFIQAVVGRIQFDHLRFFMPFQRIKIGHTHTQKTVGIDQLQYRRLFAHLVRVLRSRGWTLRRHGKTHLNRRMGNILLGLRDLHRVKITAPLCWHTGRATQVIFVQALDEHVVATIQQRCVLHLLHVVFSWGVHDVSNRTQRLIIGR